MSVTPVVSASRVQARHAPPGEEAARERGTVAVEAALIIPILILLVFGVIEWALVAKDHVEVISVSRAAARTGAALAPDSVRACTPEVTYPARRLSGANLPVVTPVTTCPPTYGSRSFTQLVANSVDSAASGLPRDSIDFILVYRANNDGFPGTRSNFGSDPSTACVGAESTCDRYVWNKVTGTFNNTSGTPWLNDSINACRDEAHKIGVYIQANHRMLTGIFGQTLNDRVTGLPLPGRYSVIRTHTVMKFEPRIPQSGGVVQCKPTTWPR